MATTVGTLVVNVIGDASQLSTSLGAAEKTIERFGSRMFFLGSRITAGVTLPMVGFMAAVNKIGSEFDQAMQESLAIMDDVSDEMRAKLEKRAMDIARTSKFTAKEVAEGYYDLASAGFDAQGALDNIGTVSLFAQAGLMQMDKAGEYLSGSVKALGTNLIGAGTEAEAMARTADVLTAANNKALGTVEDFSVALSSKFARGMKQVGMELEDGVAILMAFAQQNIKGKRASQEAYQALRDMQSATINAGKAWEAYGVSVFDATGNMRPMVDVLEQMQMRFAGFTKEQVLEFQVTGVKGDPMGKAMSDLEKQQMLQAMKIPLRSVAATQALFGSESQIKEWAQQLRDATGTTAEVAAKQGEAMAVRWSNSLDAIHNAAIRLYKAFQPILIEVFDLVGRVGDRLSEWAEKFSMLEPVTKKWVAAFAVGLTVLGPMLALLGSWILMLSGLAHVMGGMAKIVSGFTSLLKPLAGVMGQSGAAAATATGLWANLVNAGRALVSLLPNLVKLWLPILLVFDALRPALTYIIDKFGGVRGIIDSVSKTLSSSAGFWQQWWTTIKNVQTILLTFWDIVQFGWVQLVKLAELIGTDLINAWGSLNRFVDWGKAKLVEYWGAAIDLGNYLVNLVREIPILGPVLGGIWDLAGVALNFYWDLVKQFFAYIGDKLGWLGSIGGSISGALRSVLPKEYVTLVDTISNVAKNATGFHDGVRRMANGMQLYAAGIGAVDLKAKGFHRTMGQLKPALTRTGVGIDPEALGRAITGEQPQGPGAWPEPPASATQKRDPVKDAFENLMGSGERDWKNTFKAWEQNKTAIMANEEAVARLGDAYMNMRDKIDLIPELEKLFETKIAVANMENLRASIGFFLDDISPAENKLAKILMTIDRFATTQQEMIQQAGVGATVFSSEFFKKHADDIEDLSKNYGTLLPGVQIMVNEYKAWKKSVDDADDAVRYHKLNMEGLSEVFATHGEATAKLKDKQGELTNFFLSESERGLKGIQKNLAQERLAWDKNFTEMGNSLNKLTGSALDEGIKKFLEFGEIRDEYFKTSEKLQMGQLALQLGVDKLLIQSFKHMTAQKILEIAKVVAAAQKEKAIWDSISGSFAGLADAFNVGDNNVLRWLADVTAAMGNAKAAGANLRASFESISEAFKAEGGADWGAIAGGAASGFAATVQGVQAIGQATGSASRGRNIMGGAAAGAQMGMAVAGPYGAAAGLVIGAIVGAVRGKKLRDIMRGVGRDWGVDIGEELAKAIEKTMKDKGLGRVEATMEHFADIVAEAGGVDVGNFDQLSARLRDFFVLAETGAMDAEHAMALYSENFQQFAEFITSRGRSLAEAFGEHFSVMTDQLRRGVIAQRDVTNFFDQNFGHFIENIDKLGGVADSSWPQVLKLAASLDRLPPAVAEFLATTAGEASDAWVGIIKATTVEFDGLADKIKEATESGEGLDELLARQTTLAANYKDEMGRLGSMVLQTFNAGIVSGMGFMQIMGQIAPSLDTLIQGYTDLGLEIDNAAIKELTRFREMMKNNEALFTGVDMLSQGLIALSKMGGLTSKVFDDISKQGHQMFVRMQGVVAQAGGSHADALRPFLPWLAEMRNAAEEYGFVLDDNTQRLIDQAVELGLLKPKAESAASAMASGFDRVADRLERIGQLLATSLGVIWDMGDAASNINFPPPPEYSTPHVPGSPTMGGGDNGGSTPSAGGEENSFFREGGGTTVNFSLSTTQPVDEQFVQTTIIPSIVRAAETNQRGARTDLNNALGR